MLGTAVSFSGTARGALAIVAGAFMMVIGLNMLGLFSWTRKIPVHLPRCFGGWLSHLQAGQRPLLIGLLNGLMPCGPLQAMQLYALGTGGFLAGAGTMLVFGLGTVPLLFTFGTVNTMLSQGFTRGMLKASAVLVCVLGVVMVSRGLALAGVAVNPESLVSRAGVVPLAKMDGRVQVVKTVVEDQAYNPRVQVVQKGVPVRWIIEVKSLNGCNNPIVVPELGIEHRLTPGKNVIEFTPAREGILAYSCWMGMITGSFRVVKDLNRISTGDIDRYIKEDNSQTTERRSGCCGPVPPKFQGGRIPVDELAVAEIVNGEQRVTIRVNEEGFIPAVVVLQKNLPAVWDIKGESLNGCNSYLILPEYQTGGALQPGSNVIKFTPEGDFHFQCGMGMLNGYVKVVNDLKNIDLDQIRRDIKRSQIVGG